MRKRKRNGFRSTTRARRPFKRPRRTNTAAIRRNIRTGGFLGLERKFFDVESAADAFATTWAAMEPATTNLTAVAQGDGESNREGRKFSILSIHLKGFVKRPASESTTGPFGDETVRVCLVQDKQTNGAQLTATDVMDGGQTEDYLAFRNLQFTKRFNVLWDRTFTLPVSRGAMNEGSINLFATADVRVPFTVNKTFNNPIQVTMSGTTADIANVTDNSIHVIGVGSATSVTLDYQCRIRFMG